jgi:glycosyltransferase involved in cell wall biosynthesis
MPTYNDARYLPQAIDDILQQTYENFELLIVNDGSTDSTAKILNKYQEKDKRIRIFEKENGGTGTALNLGFEKAKGKYGTWVSSDDRKFKTFLEDLVLVLEKNKDIEYVFSSFYSSYLKTNFRPLQPIDSSRFKECLSGTLHNSLYTNNIYFLDKWAKYNAHQCFQGVCFMFTMNLKKICGEYIDIPGEDYHMCMKMALNTRAAYLDKVLGIHEAPVDSLSVQDRNCVIDANKLTKKLFLESDHWNLENIPKIANFYWGSEKMSFLRYMTISSFKRLNPDWSIHLYVPKGVNNSVGWRAVDSHHQCDTVDYKADEDYFKKLLNKYPIKIIEVDFSKSFLKNSSEAHRSDVCGWTTLATSGGLWCDMDIVFFKSLNNSYINKLNKKTYDTFICIDDRQDPVSKLSPIGFLLSSEKNEFFKEILNFSIKQHNPQDYQSSGASVIFNKFNNNLKFIKKTFLKNTFHNLEPSLVYYYDFKNLDKIFKNDNFDKIKNTEAIGIHWYGGHPLSQEYNNKINHKNFKNFKNTLKKAIEVTYD